MKFKARRWLILWMILPLTIISWGFKEDYFQYSKQLTIFSEVYREVNQYYVDEINPGQMIKTGINSMLEKLDPYTNYYPESEIEDYRIKYVSVDYGGIGASSFRIGDSVIVYDVLKDYPAQLADLRAGDVILAVNGRSLKGLTAEEVDDLLKGQSGTAIHLSVGRVGIAQPLEKSILRKDIKISNVSYYGMINDSTGYIKLDKFLQNCFNEMHDAVVELKKNPKMNSLVFDLRGNGGGLLEESVNILNLFIEKGKLMVTQKGKTKGSINNYETKNEPIDTEIKIAVLVDGHSASASEITAGNFQDVDRGVVIGQRSYGKGLVQQTRPLTYNAQLKVTIAKYYTASGRCVQTRVYTHRGEDGNKIEFIPDSISKPFKTKNGRTVYDASAVYPDRFIAAHDTSIIGKALVRKLLLFDYASKYRNEKDSIPPPDKFKLSDKEYNDFVKYLQTKNYSYSTQTELALEELKTTTTKDKYYANISTDWEALNATLKKNKENDLQTFKKEITSFLEYELVGRYYYKEGKYKYQLANDPEVKDALIVLGNASLYNSILKGEGEYKVIGGPGKK